MTNKYSFYFVFFHRKWPIIKTQENKNHRELMERYCKSYSQSRKKMFFKNNIEKVENTKNIPEKTHETRH